MNGWARITDASGLAGLDSPMIASPPAHPCIYAIPRAVCGMVPAQIKSKHAAKIPSVPLRSDVCMWSLISRSSVMQDVISLAGV
jgi:hypothetical protein